ncbi:MAG: thiamine pyrophosphate-dependent dehydrogenase E1 component subunit alpha [Thermoanaerobaculia bacterium]
MSAGKSFGPLHPEAEEREQLARTSLSRDQQWEVYRLMRLTRAVEERLSSLYRRGLLVGGAYSSRGQEATSVASAYALGPDDLIGPLIRNLGSQLVRGVDSGRIFALHMGKATAVNRSKDNLPQTDLGCGILGPIAMLGSLLAVVAGALLADRMKGGKRVGMSWIGDGGTSTGEFHEAINLAAVLNLPLVVVVENNGWAYSTPTSQQTRVKDLALKGAGYGVPSEIVDGNDPLAVYEAAKRAVERARTGGGPTLLEAKTFRMRGHAEHDDASYVPAELREHWLARDPIARFERHLVAEAVASQAEIDALEGELASRLDAEIEAAQAAPMPAPEEAALGVFEGAV